MLVVWMLIQALLALAVLGSADDLSFEQIVFINSVPLLIPIAFYQLEVKVDVHHVLIVFGVGLIRKKIPLSSIEEVRLSGNVHLRDTHNRQITEYSLYSVKGMDSVELLMKDEQKSIRIGCDNSIGLCEAIKSKLVK